MKFILLSLLVAYCLIGCTESLVCYKCTACGTNDRSQSETCVAPNNVCRSTYAVSFGVWVINKGCSSSCVAASTGDKTNGAGTSCCTTDNCNSGSNLKISLMSVGIIAASGAIFKFWF